MQPITSAGFREPRAASRAALAKGMIFRILSHPESKHHAFLWMLRSAWNAQKEPHVRGLSIRIGCSTGLPGKFARIRKGKREHSGFLFFRFQCPDRAAQGVHSGDDAAPEHRSRARTHIKWRRQEFNHRRRHRGMNESLLQRTVFALGVATLRKIVRILVKKRLAIVADIICESRRHSKSTVHESGC